MGQVKASPFLITFLLCMCTTLAIFSKPETASSVKQQPLSSALYEIHGWQPSADIALQKEVTESLQLDDFLYRNYRKDNQAVGLYIGYYLTSGKVGAAHDPLVCLPGQGWLVTQRGKGELTLNNDLEISYSTMVVERNGERDLYLYWFQTYDKAVASTFSQKVTALSNTLRGRGTDNAFVRLSCSMSGRTQKKCKQILFTFIQDFYPVFLDYIRESDG